MTPEDYQDYLRIKKVIEALKQQRYSGISDCCFVLIDWVHDMGSDGTKIKFESLKFKGEELGDVTVSITFEGRSE